LINFDADKVLLAIKKDNKSAEEFEQQYLYAPNYLDRREALEYFGENKMMSQLAQGLKDKYYGLRLLTLESIDQQKAYSDPAVLSQIEQMATKEANKKVQAKAIEILAKMKDNKYKSLFEKYVNDSSYSVAGAALEGLAALQPEEAYTLAKKYSNDALGKLGEVVFAIIIKKGTEADFDYLLNHFSNEPFSEEKIKGAYIFARYLVTVKNADHLRKGVDEIMKFRNQIPEQYRGFIDPAFKQVFTKISSAQQQSGNTELANYINGLLK
jgi:aminopeptidase N